VRRHRLAIGGHRGHRRRRDFVQLVDAAVDLADDVLGERPKMQVHRHQRHDRTQRVGIGFADLHEGLPERPAYLRQRLHDFVKHIDAVALADVAVRELLRSPGAIHHRRHA
jgi:hypothetical protein